MGEKREKKPCCATGALRRTRRVGVGGIAIGFATLDAVVAAVTARGIGDDAAPGAELVRRVREHNAIPPGEEARYAAAFAGEFRADGQDRRSGGCSCGCLR